MAQHVFGSGNLFFTRTDIANPTPRRVGVLQEVSVEFKFETKKLRGENRFPVDIAQAASDISGKYKLGQINGRLLADILGATAATGLKEPVSNEPGTVPTTPFQITVAGAAAFYEDLGVILAATGQQFERVASAPATGQYSVSAGVYTFAAADTGKAVLISYNTTKASPVAPETSFTLVNNAMGAAPAFALNLFTLHRSKPLWLKLFAITFSGISMPLKMDDYMLPEGSFEAFADGSGNVAAWASKE